MKIKITVNCATANDSYTVGQIKVVSDAVGADLVRAGYCEVLDSDAQPDVAIEVDESEGVVKVVEASGGAAGAVKADEKVKG
jgi:hypothetical protein